MPDLDDFRSDAADWLQANSVGAPRDYGAICPPELIAHGIDWQRRLFADGWAGIHWPVEHSGRGLTPEHQGVWLEQCARAGVPPFLNMVGLVLAGGSIMRFGTPEQQTRHLRPTLSADEVWCQLFSEPGPGSDLGSLATRADFDEVFFTDVELPADALLGPLHGGWGVGMSVLTNERGHIGASVVGLERRLAGLAQLAEHRDLAPIERHELVQLLSRGKVFTWMAQRQGPVASTAASLMKLGLTALMFDAAMLRGRIAGMDGALVGPDAAGMLAAPGGRIAGGTSQVQRNIIGERLLGLPREPKG